MKSFKLFLTLALAATFSFTAFAANGNDNPGMKVRTHLSEQSDMSLVVQLFNLQQQTTKIRLASLDGETYLRDRCANHNGYLRLLNLSELPDGRYRLDIMQEDEQATQIILVDDGRILLSDIE